MVDVSAIVVNYNSGSYTTNLVECLRTEKVRTRDGGEGSMEILVVENDSPSDQSAWLDPLRELPGVQVLETGANLGYGGGCNYGARRARGRHHLFLNPDVFVVPGGVDALREYLDLHPEAGQVGPCGWFDCHRFFHLPRIELPELSTYYLEARRLCSKERAASFALRRSKHALRIWSARAPQPEPVLAGYAFMMPADFSLELGPFDEDYPLYFEDSDLTRRVRRAGRTAMLVPRSEMVHLYNKSAGQFQAEANRKSDASQAIYWRKHYGLPGALAGAAVRRMMRRWARASDSHAFSAPQDLGPCADPPTFEVPGVTGRYVVELTLDPLYTLAVGHFEERASWSIPPGVWEHLDPARFFVRALELPSLRPLAAFTFQKTTGLVPVKSYADFLERMHGSVPNHPEAAG